MITVHTVIKFSATAPVFWDVTHAVGKLIPTILKKIVRVCFLHSNRKTVNASKLPLYCDVW
jgi:hypothetical protein